MDANLPLTDSAQATVRVMLVEDEAIVRKDVKHIIRWEDYGYHLAAEADSGWEAISILERQEIDIVISDIEMPGMSGLELAAQVLRNHTSIKFIFLTAYNDFEFARTSMRLGIDSYILKHEMSAQILLSELNRLRDELHKIGYQKTVCINEAMHSLLCVAQPEGASYKILEDNGIVFSPGASFLTLIDMEAVISEQVRSFTSAAINRTLHTADVAGSTVFTIQETGIGVLIAMRREAIADDPLRLAVIQCVNNIQAQLQSVFNRQFFISVSEMLDSDTQLYAAYQSVVGMEKQRYFYQLPRVFFQEPKRKIPQALLLLADTVCDQVEHLQLKEAQAGLEALMKQEMPAIHDPEVLKETLVPITSRIAGVWNGEHEDAAAVSPIALYQELLSLPNIYQACDRLSEMLAEIERLQSENYQNRIMVIQDYVEKNFAQDISLEQLGELIGVSGAYMSQLFKQRTGVSFKNYLMKIRMKRAEELLCASDCKIRSVGEAVGYSSTPYFCLVFKQHSGMTPREYSRKCAGRG